MASIYPPRQFASPIKNIRFGFVCFFFEIQILSTDINRKTPKEGKSAY